jgi:hypothetical protein
MRLRRSKLAGNYGFVVTLPLCN